MATRTHDTPTFTVTLREGMANRNRLALSDVVRVLYELEEMIRAVGRVVQRDNGVQLPTGDFGVELLATAQGAVFRKGSIKATAAITRDIPNGKRTVQQIIQTADALERKKPVSLIDEAGTQIARRLSNIGEVQRGNKTHLELKLSTPGQKKRPHTIFTESGIQVLEALDSEPIKVDAVSLFGRIRELRDRSKTEDGGRYFWGELMLDNGDVWRLKFNATDAQRITKLFMKQVEVTGEATYFAAKSPSLRVQQIEEDKPRDYLAAFDELQGCDKDVYGNDDLDALVNEMRGAG